MFMYNPHFIRNFKLLIPLLLLSFFTYAQNGTVKGVVKDAAGMTLSGASVQLQGVNIGAVTDMNGQYNFSA